MRVFLKMGSDWKQLIGTVITGLIFSFLVAKLISIVNAFKDHNIISEFRVPDLVRVRTGDLTERAARVGDDNSIAAEKGGVRGADENDALLDGVDGDGDWEKVERTELDDASSTYGSGSDQPQMGQVESSTWVMI